MRPTVKPLAALLVSLLLSLSAVAALPIDYQGALSLLSDPKAKALILDVRTAEEYAEGHIPGALLIPYDQLEKSFSEKDRNRPLIVYCRSGRRSAIAVKTLEAMGYKKVYDLGGMGNWKGRIEKK
jgi:rhodanese-related sulfurtransferase